MGGARFGSRGVRPHGRQPLWNGEDASVDTSPGGGEYAALVVRRDRDPLAVPDALACGSRASDLLSADARPARSGRRSHVDRAGPDMVRLRGKSPSAGEIARRALAEAADQLLADARRACRRDGVRASRHEIFARIARQIGLSQVEVAEDLRRHVRRRATAAIPPPSTTVADQEARCLRLAETVLGAREREVFLARYHAGADPIEALQQLAARLGVRVERIYELEASACYKLTRALG